MFPLLFVMLCLLLGLGGLLRERAVGTVAFTLALPVTRRELAVTRAVAGILQVAVLALLPALLIPTLSPLVLNESYPIADALAFSMRWTAWGSVFFAIGFLYSSTISNEYTAAVACVLTPFLYLPMMLTIAGDEDRWPAANYMEYMHGGRTNEVALVPLVVMTIACASIVAAAATVTGRRDF
jgi:ABC-2 type transport system permease protein